MSRAGQSSQTPYRGCAGRAQAGEALWWNGLCPGEAEGFALSFPGVGNIMKFPAAEKACDSLWIYALAAGNFVLSSWQAK